MYYLILLLLTWNLSYGRIYVCFPFFNELDVLEIHLNELYDHVDYFVIAESCETFTGIEKPFNFEENKGRFAPYLDKIKYIKSYDRMKTGPWPREHQQRHILLEGLQECAPTDLILLCDCDEIVSPKALEEAIKLANEQTVVLFTLDMYKYYLNLYKSRWTAPVLSQYKIFKEVSPEKMRRVRRLERFKEQTCDRYQVAFVRGGWHFTSLGGGERVREKMRSFSHANHDRTKNFLENFDLNFAQAVNELQRRDIDERFPKFVLQNLDLMIDRGLVQVD